MSSRFGADRTWHKNRGTGFQPVGMVLTRIVDRSLDITDREVQRLHGTASCSDRLEAVLRTMGRHLAQTADQPGWGRSKIWGACPARICWMACSAAFTDAASGCSVIPKIDGIAAPRRQMDDAVLRFLKGTRIGIVRRRLQAGDVTVGDAGRVLPEREAGKLPDVELQRRAERPRARCRAWPACYPRHPRGV